jgi:hypothetical protein
MFDIYCPRCVSRRLIFPSQVVGIDNDGTGIAVRFECWCGATGTWNAGSHHVAWHTAPLAATAVAA